MEGPQLDDWWLAIVTDKKMGTPLGEISMMVHDPGHAADIGYTFTRESWDKGLATEAVTAWVDHLFNTVGVGRIGATLHPENTASARVLEKNGFIYEGHTRLSTSVDGEVSDDWIYGQTKEDHQAWINRNQTKVDSVELRPIDTTNERDIYRLKTHWSQRQSVSPMEHSFTDALFPEIYNGYPMIPWLRGVYADDEAVAFVLMGWPTPGQPEPYLWRLLIDRLHQRRGIGTLVVDAMVDECRTRGATVLTTSWNPDKHGPSGFYLKYGFEPTGEIEDDEVVARFTFSMDG